MKRDIIVFDLETTGVDVDKDRIVQIACRKFDHNFNEIGEMKTLLINPLMSIPQEASDVHGITNEMVADLPSFEKYAKSLFDYFQDCDLAGFNSNRFDIPLLHREFSRYGFTWIVQDLKFLDAYKVFSHFEKRDLTSAYKFFCDKVLEGAHDAGNDVNATVEIIKAQMSKYDIDTDEINNIGGAESRCDLAGCILSTDEGFVFGFGKHKGELITDRPSYAYWMMKSDFTNDTKEWLKGIIE